MTSEEATDALLQDSEFLRRIRLVRIDYDTMIAILEAIFAMAFLVVGLYYLYLIIRNVQSRLL